MIMSEAERKRELSGTGAQRECEPENRSESERAPTGGDGVDRTASPVPCAECGTEMHAAEAARAADPEFVGSKFAGLCYECTRLALGLL